MSRDIIYHPTCAILNNLFHVNFRVDTMWNNLGNLANFKEIYLNSSIHLRNGSKNISISIFARSESKSSLKLAHQTSNYDVCRLRTLTTNLLLALLLFFLNENFTSPVSPWKIWNLRVFFFFNFYVRNKLDFCHFCILDSNFWRSTDFF